MSLKVVFEKLYPSYSKKLWKFILEESVSLFIQMLLITSLKYQPDEKNQMLTKIQGDQKNMEEIFLNVMSSKDVKQAMEKLCQLIAALQDSPELVPAHIVKLRVAMGKQYNDNCTVSSCNGLEMHPENEIRHPESNQTNDHGCH